MEFGCEEKKEKKKNIYTNTSIYFNTKYTIEAIDVLVKSRSKYWVLHPQTAGGGHCLAYY